jgi:hypothetical protein
MRTAHSRSLTVALVVLAPVGARLSVAVPVGPGDFGPGAIFESFEGLSPGPNIPAVGNGAFLRPGESTIYTFASGVSLTWPIPNPSVCGVRVGDFARGDASAWLLLGHDVRSTADVPFGSAYLIAGDESGRAPFVEFTFPSDMLRVGAYVGGSWDWGTIYAFDAAGTLIETRHGGAAWENNFLAIQDQRGIRRVQICGEAITLVVGPRNTLIDGLTFEPLPEPGTIVLLLTAAILAHVRRPGRPARF